MTVEAKYFVDQLTDILRSSRIRISDLKPSEWAEKYRVLTSDITSRPGAFKYSHTPYLTEVVNRLSPYDPAKIIAVRKGAQIGYSTGVIESGIGWIISENPGNILFMTGSSDLTEIAMNKKIDQMIDSCGLRPLIRANSQRLKNQRTGDTKKGKEFPGGSLIAGNASNHKMLRQISVRYGFLDDLDSIKKSSDQSGDTISLFMKRFAAYRETMKVFLISTPEQKSTSNIDEAFDLGDQRYFKVPCPCCGDYIVLEWAVEIPGSKRMAGINWQLDKDGKLIESSVKYICQSCGKSFDESHKHKMLQMGSWEPTAEPSQPGYYSYQISALYAPAGHFNWVDAVREYLQANPASGRLEEKWKVFLNTVLGQSYELSKASPDANKVQAGIRHYKIGTVPEWVSEKDGNGKIVMLTCAADLNGVEEDARLDYEVVAWSESGSSYSVTHGSIGTFVIREDREERMERTKWTYDHKRQRSVWPKFEEILRRSWKTDTGRDMQITVTGVDTGHYTDKAYTFVDTTNIPGVFGVRGDKEEQYRKYKADLPIFKRAKERPNMYLFDVNYIKDLLADLIKLNWDAHNKEDQPPGFMNYPEPSNGLYGFENFFKHYQAEHRVDEVKAGVSMGTRWKKKQSNLQNHCWDLRVYNYALKEMWASMVLQEAGKKGTWNDFVKYLLEGV